METNFNNKATVEEIRERFEHDVERFSNLETGQKAIPDAPLMMELITRAAAACTPNAKSVLDIGCGGGNNTLKLLELINPLDCYLLDLAKAMTERAHERVSKINKGNTIVVNEDIRTADLPEGKFDIIIAAAVLHHLRSDSDWENVFTKIYRLLAPGGGIWISDLFIHENQSVQNILWEKYGEYLMATGGNEMKKKAFDAIEREDTPRPITYQIELLRKIGFSKIDILHKTTSFAAYGAVKPL